MLFLSFSSDVADAFRSKYHEVAEKFRTEGVSFLVGDLEASQGAFQVCGFPWPVSINCLLYFCVATNISNIVLLFSAYNPTNQVFLFQVYICDVAYILFGILICSMICITVFWTKRGSSTPYSHTDQ